MLAVHSRLSESSSGFAYLGKEIDTAARGWRRSSNSRTGYKVGSFTLSENEFTPNELSTFYAYNIGCRVVELTSSDTTWEGYIMTMQLKQDGKTYEQTLDPRYFANKIKCKYMNDIAQTADTGWSENTDSSDIFGESGVVIPLSGASDAGATSLRDARLVEMAWPRSRQVRGDAIQFETGDGGVDELRVIVAGYYSTLALRWRETTIAAAAANTQISTVVALSEFVTAGRVETNSTSLRIDAFPQAKQLSTIIKEIIDQGETGGTVWQGGVYADRKFVYEAAPTSWEYQMDGDVLMDTARNPVKFETVEPGFLLYNPSAPAGWQRPGTSSDWDNPKVAYVEEVELISGGETDELRMRYRNAPAGADVIARQILGGNF